MNSTIWLGVAAVKRLRQWLADRRWRREQPAREAWVTLYDTNGNAVHTSPAILAPTTLLADIPVSTGQRPRSSTPLPRLPENR